MVLEQTLQTGKQPNDNLSFSACILIEGLQILSAYPHCIPLDLPRSFQGTGKEEQADILLCFPLTAELSSRSLVSNNDVQIKISYGFASPRWDSAKAFKNQNCLLTCELNKWDLPFPSRINLENSEARAVGWLLRCQSLILRWYLKIPLANLGLYPGAQWNYGIEQSWGCT